MNCIYTINNKKFSYEQLFELILNNLDSLGTNVSDIIFSTNLKLKVIEELLEHKNVKGIKLVKSNLENGSLEIEERLDILKMLDNPNYTTLDGRPPLVTPFNESDYRQRLIEELIAKTNAETPLELKIIESVVDLELALKDNIIEAGEYVHYVTYSHLARSKLNLENIDNIVSKMNVPDNWTNRAATELLVGLNNVYKRNKGSYADSICKCNLTLKAKLKNFDEELFGHIDWLFIDEDGTLHLYLVKTTGTDIKNWSDSKVKKYKYELAFLKSILALNGFNVKYIDLNIIPVKVEFNKDQKVSKAVVLEPRSYSSTKSNATYAMELYDRNVRNFIEYTTLPLHISNEYIKRALSITEFIFPLLNIKEEGIAKSAREWINKAPSENYKDEPLVIKRVDDIDHIYEVIINGKKYNISEKTKKERNTEIYELVKKHIEELEDNKGYTANSVRTAIKSSFKLGFSVFESTPGLKNLSFKLETALSKYFNDYTVKNDEKFFNWELMDLLTDSNILMFKHKKTGIIDFVDLSTYDLNARCEMPKGSNLLGCYFRDVDYKDLDADYGNIEMVRAMELINEMIPELGNEAKLGNIMIISSLNGDCRSLNIGDFNKNYFQKIVRLVNGENPELKIQNNFSKILLNTLYDDLVSLFEVIMSSRPPHTVNQLNEYGFDELSDIENDDVKKEDQLYTILKNIQESNPYVFSNPDNVIKLLNSGTQNQADLAKLYILVGRTYLSLRGETPKFNLKFGKLGRTFFTPMTVDSDNVKYVVNNLQITHDSIAREFIKEYDNGIRKAFNEYYKSIGYNSLENRVINFQASTFKNLYDRDSEFISFKNPYDRTNNLTEPERKLLKYVLYKLNWIYNNGNSKFSSEEDPKIPLWIEEHPEYLWVPLERASKSTLRQSKEALVAKLRNTFDKVKSLSQSGFDEFVENLTDFEREAYGGSESNFYRLSLKNPFFRSIPGTLGVLEAKASRHRMIELYGKGFFETNVENILIDVLALLISTTLYQKLLVGTKALLLEMKLTGDFNGDQEKVDLETKYITDYLKVNVFRLSIMSPTERKIVGILSPVKTMVSHLLLSGNLASWFRDTFEGVLLSFIRSAIKLRTDIDAKSLAKAYAYVVKNGSSNTMAVNLLNKICLRYRVSNTDVGRIAERAKTARGGITDIETWMYSTLRNPDFINRMSLLVGKMMHDGVWDAIDIDKDGKLTYDWTKDKRFKAYKYGVKGSTEYNEAKARVLSRIKEYNEEHPNATINSIEELPEPYSDQVINSIKSTADNIYGAYDKSKRSMAENHAYGFMFGLFSTWMNGIINTWFMPALKSSVSLFIEELAVDNNGNLLYWDEDGTQTTKDTGVKVLNNVPIPVLGILPMIGDFLKLASSEGWKETWKEYYEKGTYTRSNFNKLFSDLILWLLLGILFKSLLNKEWKEYKKDMSENPLIQNMVVELLYKGTSRSFSLYAGPLNVVEYFGENMNPPFYTVPTELINNAYLVLFGNRSALYLVTNSLGLAKTFKTSISSELKK